MLLKEIKNIKSSKEDLRKFGLTLGIVFGLITAIIFWKHRELNLGLVGISSFFLLFTFLCPGFLKPIQKIWMALALCMGWVMTRVLLGVVFYFVMTPISFIAKLTGKKFLNLGSTPDVQSYWVDRQSIKKSK